jgi:hypothetical protein
VLDTPVWVSAPERAPGARFGALDPWTAASAPLCGSAVRGCRPAPGSQPDSLVSARRACSS